MTALLTRRGGRRAASAVLALTVVAGAMLFGAGAAAAAPTQVVCTVLGGPLNAPVAVQQGEQVQLVLVVPIVGTKVFVGPAQNVGSDPGAQVISATVTNVLGLVGQVCQAAVSVQAIVSSAAPLPPLAVPSMPVAPSKSVTLPLPGANVGVGPGTQQNTPPSTGTPAPGTPTPGRPGGETPLAPGAGPIDWRFDNARIPLYDFSSVPYGVGYRFGNIAAPAFRFGQQVPGYAPQFGILGADSSDDVATVGTVQALPVGGAKVALPVLLAVLLLAAVTGTLVRSWVLTRS